MIRLTDIRYWITILLCWFAASSLAQSRYAGFEGRQVYPVELTPDGSLLLALHSEAAALCLFDPSGPVPAPVKLGEVPTGLEPVSVRARTNDEAWVVNEVSDTISVISLSGRRVTAILPTGDEPSDVVFAAGKAFVTCARTMRFGFTMQ